MKTFRLHLVRHGLTQGNLDGIYMGGGLDQPLCEQGVEALCAYKQRFAYPRVDTLFLSPMKRATMSADILFPEAKNRYELEDLREIRFGGYEGKSVAQLAGDPGFKRWLDPTSDFVPPHGESGRAFNARCAKALLGMMEFLIKRGISEAACVAHGGVIMSMLGQCALPQRPATDWMADNGTGFTVISSASMLMRDGKVEAVDIVPGGWLEALKAGEVY